MGSDVVIFVVAGLVEERWSGHNPVVTGVVM
jgi:hypothetical protein